MCHRFLRTTFLLIAFLLPATLLAQTDFSAIRADWRAGNYASVVPELQAFFATVSDDTRNFEADYMMASSLSAITEFHGLGCRYFTSMFRLYQSPFTGAVDGTTVSLRTAYNQACVQPGVKVVEELRIEKRSGVLQDLQKTSPKKFAGKAALGRAAEFAAADILQFTGIYDMVHDGWRGTLELKGGIGEYIDANRRAYRVNAEIHGTHIIFYVVGLGGENADGRGGQKFEGYLMSQTRDDIAGLTWWQGQPFGFYAIRRKR